jgi:hypothetical protein
LSEEQRFFESPLQLLNWFKCSASLQLSVVLGVAKQSQAGQGQASIDSLATAMLIRAVVAVQPNHRYFRLVPDCQNMVHSDEA